MMALGTKAYLKIMPKVSGRYWIRQISSTRPPSRYSMAMMGTIFSVTLAMRWMPPRKTNTATRATSRPTTQEGTPKAVEQVAPMELDCTMQPMKPRARMMATAKKPARNLPRPPFTALRM